MRSVARWPNADSRAELEFPRHLLYAWVTRVTKWSMVWCRKPIFFYFFSPLQFPRQTLLFSKQSFNLFCLQIYTFEYFVLFKWNWNWFLISSFLNFFYFLYLVLILLITIFFVFYIFSWFILFFTDIRYLELGWLSNPSALGFTLVSDLRYLELDTLPSSSVLDLTRVPNPRYPGFDALSNPSIWCHASYILKNQTKTKKKKLIKLTQHQPKHYKARVN
jgi:hypothetical protein